MSPRAAAGIAPAGDGGERFAMAIITTHRAAASASPSARLRTTAQIDAARAQAGDPATGREQAIHLLGALLAVRPGDVAALGTLRDVLAQGDVTDPAAAAARMATQAQLDHPMLRRAAAAIARRQVGEAVADLRRFLADHPADPVGLRLMANAARLGHDLADAERLLVRALDIAPTFDDARRNLIDVLLDRHRFDAALEHIDHLLAADPASRALGGIKAATLKRAHRIDDALALYDALLAAHPDDADLLIDRGNALRSAGRGEAAAATFRRAVAAHPNAGRGWLALADLKTAPFDDRDVAVMRDALLDDALPLGDRVAIDFAVGHALERQGDYRAAFAHYVAANALHRTREPYDPVAAASTVAVTHQAIDAMAGRPAPSRAGGGAPAPIFVIGLPRSGSTLVERILAAHPRIEATEELPYLGMLANELRRQGAYADLASARPYALADVRARYMALAAPHCRQGADFFIDKAPSNWRHLPLIVAAFPDARIVDARRDPLDCGVSNFAQSFGRGNEFSYSLAGIVHYHGLYRQLIAAGDAAWPGRIHRIDHEALVDAPDAVTRALLGHIGVAWDAACLRFHESRGVALSASSEQVRRPLNRDGIGRWRRFAPWLGPLQAALGDYPQGGGDDREGG